MNEIKSEGTIPESADVVVIGGGVIGSSIAYFLSKEGSNVTLVEKNGICSGASGRNQGGATFSRTLPPFASWAQKSIKIYDTLEEELNYDFDLEEMDLLLCALNVDEEKEALMREVESKIRNIGTNCQFYSKDELGELDFPFGPKVGGVIKVINGIYLLWPFKLVYGLMGEAKRRGANVLTNTEVRDIQVTNGRVSSVKLDGGEISTHYVVNAAGVWSPEIGKMVGLNIPVEPRRGEILVTEPVNLYKFRYLMDFGYFSVEHSEKEGLAITTTLMQHLDGNWTVGSSREMAGFSTNTTVNGATSLAKKATEFFPELGSMHCIRSYAGLRPFCRMDGNPIVGEADEVEGFVIATGHGGGGVKYGPLTGKMLSKEILNKNFTSDLLKPYRYSRFNFSSSPGKSK